jgi:LCP family protein required for cell wall assembly
VPPAAACPVDRLARFPGVPDQPTDDADVADSTAPPVVVGRKARMRARRSKRRRRRVLVILLSLIGLVVLVAAAGAGFLWYENGRIHRVDVKHLSTVRTAGDQKDVENILLIGSTTRCGLKQQNPAFGLCDEGVTGVNSDVVMILHLDPDHHRASILSIPRDTFIPNARPVGVNKIDAALGSPQGPNQLIAAITDDFGIPIQHYVQLNFDSFQGVVQALGGLKMYFPMPVYDQESSLYVPDSGCTTLNGFEALAVVRARHLQYQPSDDRGVPRYDWPYDPQSDLSRIRRDHEFLRVLAATVAKRGLGNFITDLKLIDSLSDNLVVDNSFSATSMANLILDFHGVDPYAVPQFTLPVVVDGQGYYYQGDGYGDVVFPVQPEDREVVSEFLGTKTTEDATGRALPSPGSFSVAVENGSGLEDQGSQTAAALTRLGYHVTSVTDSPAAATTTETTILYSDPSALGEALRLQTAMAGLAVVGYDPGLLSGTGGENATGTSATTTSTIDVGSALPESVKADVVIVTGSNFSVVAPPTSTGPTSTGPTSTGPTSTGPTSSGPTTVPTSTPPSSTAPSTTVPAPLADNPNLAAPSGSTQPLEPWDPRSCTPSGGEGA